MAFEGDLKELEFGDVVQTLSMTRQHGTLVVHGANERRVAFSERGMALLSARRSHGERVGQFLVGTGRISAEALDSTLRSIRRADGAAVGDALLDAGLVDPQSLLAARRYVAQDELFELFGASEGRFEFLADELNLTGPFSTLWFDVGSVAMEAARRLDETPRLDEIVPSGEVLTHGDPAAAPGGEGVSHELLQIYALADGSRTVHDVTLDHHLGEFDVRKALASLVDSSALRFATAGEILDAAEILHDAGRAARLLRRAVELEPTQSVLWEKLAKALAASGEKSAAANALCEVAALEYADGNGDSALGTLRTALKLDRASTAAHAQLTRILFALELVDDGIKAAQTGVSECLAAEAPDVALDIAAAALQFAPDDTRLGRGSAAAYAALGEVAQAVTILDALAHDLAKARGQESELREIYRSILSLAPDRADCHEKLQALAQREAQRKRRRTQFVAAAAALLLIGSIGVPAILGDSVQSRLDEMNELVQRGELDRVQVLLNELRDENIDEELLQNAVEALEQRIEDSRRPPLDPDIPRSVRTRLDTLYEASRTALSEKRMVDGLESLVEAAPIVASDDIKTIEESSPAVAKTFRDGYDTEVESALAETEEHCMELGLQVSRAKEQLAASEALKRAKFTTEPDDLEELQRLAELAKEVEEVRALNDWERLKEVVPEVVELTRTKPRERIAKIVASIENLTTAMEQAREDGEHAIAHVHRLRLLTEFRTARNEGADLVREGNLERAAELYEQYLEFCAEVRETERGEVYERIVRGYMETFQLEELVQEQLEQSREILARELTAELALQSGDVAAAFDMRVKLVRDFPHVGFSARFALPLRIESTPAGADIVLVGPEEETTLGHTTSIVEYPAVGESTIAVRLDGFEEVLLERHGAFEDSDGTMVLELAKRPLWSSPSGAATEAAPVAWKDRVFVVDRDGVVRSLSLEDGTELGRLETGLLGGFAGTPTVRGDRLYLAGVDGVAYVVDAASLAILKTIELPGAVRTSLLATAKGVVVVDERGTVHLIDPDGEDVWSRDVGSVVVDPAATEDRVVVVTLDGQLLVLSLDDGEELRRTRIPGQPRWSAPVVADGRAYVSTDAGGLTGIDLATGEVTWEAGIEEVLVGRPAVAGEVVAVPTASGRVLVTSLGSDEPPHEAGEIGPLGDGVAAVNDGFVAIGRTGVVRRLDGEGRLLWRFDAGDAMSARPLWFDGRLIIVTRAGHVIALSD